MNDIIFSVDCDAYTSPCRSPSSSKIDKYWKKKKIRTRFCTVWVRLSPWPCTVSRTCSAQPLLLNESRFWLLQPKQTLSMDVSTRTDSDNALSAVQFTDCVETVSKHVRNDLRFRCRGHNSFCRRINSNLPYSPSELIQPGETNLCLFVFIST